jgi:hypothetical protein
LYTWIPEEFLQHTSILGEQGLGDGEADRTERAEYSGKSASDILPGDPGDRDHCTPYYVHNAQYIPHANIQLHHQMKIQIYLNSHTSKHWKYFQEVIDNISKNMKHLWVFVFLLVVPRGE